MPRRLGPSPRAGAAAASAAAATAGPDMLFSGPRESVGASSTRSAGDDEDELDGAAFNLHEALRRRRDSLLSSAAPEAPLTELQELEARRMARSRSPEAARRLRLGAGAARGGDAGAALSSLAQLHRNSMPLEQRAEETKSRERAAADARVRRVLARGQLGTKSSPVLRRASSPQQAKQPEPRKVQIESAEKQQQEQQQQQQQQPPTAGEAKAEQGESKDTQPVAPTAAEARRSSWYAIVANAAERGESAIDAEAEAAAAAVARAASQQRRASHVRQPSRRRMALASDSEEDEGEAEGEKQLGFDYARAREEFRSRESLVAAEYRTAETTWKSVLFPTIVAIDRRELFLLERWLAQVRRLLADDFERMPPLRYMGKARSVYGNVVRDWLHEEHKHFPQRARIAGTLFECYEELLAHALRLLRTKRAIFKHSLQRELQDARSAIAEAEQRRRAAETAQRDVESRFAKHKELTARIAAKLEVYRKFVYFKTGRTDVTRDIEEAVRSGRAAEAVDDLLLPSQLFALARDAFRFEEWQRNPRGRLRRGDDDDSAEDEEEEDNEMAVRTEGLRYSIVHQLEQLDARAGERADLSTSFAEVHDDEKALLADVSATLEREVAVSQSNLANFASGVLASYRSRLVAATSRAVQTTGAGGDGVSLAASAGLGGSSDASAASEAAAESAAPAGDAPAAKQPAPPSHRRNNSTVSGLTALPALTEERDAAAADGDLAPPTQASVPPLAKRGSALSVASPPPPPPPPAAASSPLSQTRRASIPAAVAPAPPLAVAAAAGGRGGVTLEAGDVVLLAAPGDAPIAIPAPFRRLIGRLPPHATHALDLSPQGLARLATQALAAKARANRIDDAAGRERQPLRTVLFELLLEQQGEPVAARKALLDALVAVRREAARAGASSRVGWLAYFCGLSKTIPHAAAEAAPDIEALAALTAGAVRAAPPRKAAAAAGAAGAAGIANAKRRRRGGKAAGTAFRVTDLSLLGASASPALAVELYVDAWVALHQLPSLEGGDPQLIPLLGLDSRGRRARSAGNAARGGEGGVGGASELEASVRVRDLRAVLTLLQRHFPLEFDAFGEGDQQEPVSPSASPSASPRASATSSVTAATAAAATKPSPKHSPQVAPRQRKGQQRRGKASAAEAANEMDAPTNARGYRATNVSRASTQSLALPPAAAAPAVEAVEAEALAPEEEAAAESEVLSRRLYVDTLLHSLVVYWASQRHAAAEAMRELFDLFCIAATASGISGVVQGVAAAATGTGASGAAGGAAAAAGGGGSNSISATLSGGGTRGVTGFEAFVGAATLAVPQLDDTQLRRLYREALEQASEGLITADTFAEVLLARPGLRLDARARLEAAAMFAWARFQGELRQCTQTLARRAEEVAATEIVHFSDKLALAEALSRTFAAAAEANPRDVTRMVGTFREAVRLVAEFKRERRR